MNYEDIKRHFESSPPPKEVKWTQWAYISDTQQFLKSCYIGIRNFNGPLDRCPAWWHLRDFYILMKKTSQQNAAAEGNQLEENPAGEVAAEQHPPQTETDGASTEEISQAEAETAV
ncbi:MULTISPECIES: DUF6965 family protein [Flavobacterium]|uniref:DUF6965 family protein n=1 Tax=Flavobacterium TaxID=237 RepID=UPI001182E880|nr:MULTISPECIES: hypothetical protein [Flavobacterium]MCR4032129.1 hypothetical protein [Flavobacterium panacis]